MASVTIPHKTYDLVIDNDWAEHRSIELFMNGSTKLEVIRFAVWCGRVSGTKLRVKFINRSTVVLSPA